MRRVRVGVAVGALVLVTLALGVVGQPDPFGPRLAPTFEHQPFGGPFEYRGDHALAIEDLDADGDGEGDEIATLVRCPADTTGVDLYGSGGRDSHLFGVGCLELPSLPGPLTSGDIVGDDKDEILVPLPRSGEIWVIQRGGRNGLQERAVAVPLPPSSVEVADLDRDGTAELVVTDDKGVASYDAAGGHRTPIVESTLGVLDVAVADLGGDRRQEVLTLMADGRLQVTARVGGVWRSREIGRAYGSLHTGDIDGDGRTDIVLGTHRGVVVLRMTGPALRADLHRLPMNGLMALDLGDVDLDGDEDLLVTGTTSASVLAHDPLRTSGFGTVAGPFPTDGAPASLADPNQDGWPDVVASPRGQNAAFSAWLNQAVDNPPVAFDRHLVVGDTHPASLQLLGYDRDDPDGDVHVQVVRPPRHGNLAPDGGKVVTYTPAEGFHGHVAFTYRVIDETGDRSPTATVILEVVANRPPVAFPVDEVRTRRNQAVDISVSGQDLDSDPLSVIADDPPHGRVEVTDATTLRYRPDPGYFGTDRFTTHLVDDRGGRSDPVVVTVRVNENQLPVIEVPDDLAVDTGRLLRVRPVVTDPDGEPVTWRVLYETARRVGDTVVFRAPLIEDQDAGFILEATDSRGGTTERYVRVTLRANRPPPERSFAVRTAAGEAVDIRLTATDPDGDPAWADHVGRPEHGRLQRLGPNRVRYTPDPGFVGEDRFLYVVSDDRDGLGGVRVRITVD